MNSQHNVPEQIPTYARESTISSVSRCNLVPPPSNQDIIENSTELSIQIKQKNKLSI